MKKIKLIIILGTIIFLFNSYFIYSYEFTKQHEIIHEQIETHFGCKKFETNVGFFKGSSKCIERVRILNENEKLLKTKMHLENEIESYYIIPLFRVLFFLISSFILTSIIISKRWE